MTEQIYRLRFQILMGQSEGVKKYRVLRKDRARVLTVLRERSWPPRPGRAETKMSDEKANSRKNEKVGEVVSTKMAKTIVVASHAHACPIRSTSGW